MKVRVHADSDGLVRATITAGIWDLRLLSEGMIHKAMDFLLESRNGQYSEADQTCLKNTSDEYQTLADTLTTALASVQQRNAQRYERSLRESRRSEIRALRAQIRQLSAEHQAS